jgi:hypothetical protein
MKAKSCQLVKSKIETLTKIMVVVVIFAVSGCQTNRPCRPPAVFPNDPQGVALEKAIFEMEDAYVKANFGATKPEDGFPPRYWKAPIKALKPIKVYDDQGNIVIVQKITNGVESGKYFISMESSHLLQFVHDFILTPIRETPRGSLYDFRKENPH